MKIQITFCVIVMFIWTSVNSQRICEIKCYEYSRIPSNSSNHLPHMAVWVTRIKDPEMEFMRYVILISDKFLLGTGIITFGPFGSDEPSDNKIYFTPTDSHNVTKILLHPLFEFHTDTEFDDSTYTKIILLKIDRITLDSHHRAACLWARNDFFPNTVQHFNRHVDAGKLDLTLNQPPAEGLFDNELITKEVSYSTSDCPLINSTKGHNSFCLNITELPVIFLHFQVVMQVPKPFYYLPTNYYVFGVGTHLGDEYSTYYNVPISAKMDWIESQVWGTDDTSCGTATININPVILHSQPTEREEFPWHAALFHITGIGRSEYKCGGTLLNEVMVVTAAHCVSSPTGTLSHESLTIIMGKHDLNFHSLDSRQSRIIKVTVHPSYNRHNFENDIALLKLHTMMRYSKYIQPICITANRQLFENPMGVLPGWGLDEFNEQQSILAKGSFPIRPQSECRGHGDIITAISGLVNENNFCAGFENGTSLCNGDSGGGLVFKINDKWFLRGIASVGASLSVARQCDPLGLSLFTDVIQFYSWIVDEMDLN